MSTTMLLEKIKSEGLAHLSYLVGHKGRAAVIDPRRDWHVYVDMAHRSGARITHIFETHRNEDYVVGSKDLARETGAEIYHGKNLDFSYGNPVREGDEFEFGDIVLKILETPGHTFESISIALYDKGFGEDALGVFTGDLLFIGAVGRTDFFPDRAREVAGLQYDGIFDKILPLGDQVILYPAHGAGSVCGSGMAPREFSTLGYERKNNPMLKVKSREDFIEMKIKEDNAMPPYFKKMEAYNQHGSAPPIECIPNPKPMDTDDFAKAMDDGMVVLDIRSPEAFAGAFIPGALALPLEMIPAYAGYFLPYDKEIGFVGNSYQEAEDAVRHLIRLGYDRISGFLTGGMHSWEIAGKPYDRIEAVHVKELVEGIKQGSDFTLLDVREKTELAETGKLPGAMHIFLGDLPDRIDRVPKDKPVTTFCGSGQRAIIAASILKQNGFDQVGDSLGSMSACIAAGCPIENR